MQFKTSKERRIENLQLTRYTEDKKNSNESAIL